MKVDIWMPVYIGDYLRDTQDLSDREHGVYFLILMHYWQMKGEIGGDVDRLARVARTDRNTAEYILGRFFKLEDGHYKNQRSDEEIVNANSRRESAAENGKKGGRPRINPEITHRLNEGKPKQNPEANPQKSSSPSPSPSQSTPKNGNAPRKAKRSSPERSDEDRELYESIKQAFLSQNDDQFSSWGKEGKHLWGLVDRVKARSPDNPMEFARQMLEVFWRLKRSQDRFWSGQPFLASALDASGIWDRVLEAWRQQKPAEVSQEEFQELAGMF